MTQTQSVLDKLAEGAGHILFSQPDNENPVATSLMLPKCRWEAMGEPKQITVTIRPGDELN